MAKVSKAEEKLLAKLLDLLSYSSRAEKEVRSKARQFLRKIEMPEGADTEMVIENVISILKEEGLVDDFLYAKRYVEGLVLSPKNKSVREAMQFLLRKGIPEDIAESVLEEWGQRLESKAIRSLIEKKARIYGSLNNPVVKQKIIKYLISKGFGYETVKSEIDKIAPLK